MSRSLDYFKALGKADLHVHADGAVPKDALIDIAKMLGIELDPKQLEHYPNPGPYNAAEDPEGFQHFLDNFELVKKISQSEQGIYEMIMAVIHNLSEKNVVHAELRMAPSYHTAGGLSMEEVVGTTLEAMDHALGQTYTSTKLVLAIPREIHKHDESGNGITADDIVAVARNFQDQGVVGIDLACDEFNHGPEPYIKAFQSTLGTDLKRYVHAGEAGPRKAENLITALRDMHADVISHALPLGVDPRLDPYIPEIIDRGVRIERCPLSNLAMCASDGNLDGLQRLIESGVKVVIGSDDPGIFGEETNLAHNLHYVTQKLNLKWWQVDDLTGEAFKASF